MLIPHVYSNDGLPLVKESILLRLDLYLCTPYVLYSLRKRANLTSLSPLTSSTTQTLTLFLKILAVTTTTILPARSDSDVMLVYKVIWDL